ncbi:MAG: amidase [Burkholderiales bacterium]|nr:amidase [Burkholderiales bacterium]MBK8665759.1 amidase [Burkholderiales bacterium]
MPLTSFHVHETTIQATQAALLAGQVTCVQLAEQYLARIAAYDVAGPGLNAMLAINPALMQEAAALDHARRAAPQDLPPLHGVAVAVKDNLNLRGLPTTGGVRALADLRARHDAFVVARLRAAGAMIIGKTNLHEFALAGLTVSSLKGQTRNPYELGRTPGGSSGGSGVAVAASLALVGIGTDTGQSIRSPASALALVGLRPTRGLVSRGGVMPGSVTQDTVGPLARTAEDAARLLDAIAGFDVDDPSSAACVGQVPASYTAQLKGDALAGARIGVLRQMFGTEDRHAEVNRVVLAAADAMAGLGATLLDINVPELDALTADQVTADYEMRAAFDRYLAGMDTTAATRSLEAIVAGGDFHPSVAANLRAALDGQGMADPAYAQIFVRRDQLRTALLLVMARHQLDAILYPHQKILVVPVDAEAQTERNGVLSNATGMPAISFPAGFSAPNEQAPAGVPIGVELLGRDWSEARLLAYAHAFELATRTRVPPFSTPRL